MATPTAKVRFVADTRDARRDVKKLEKGLGALGKVLTVGAVVAGVRALAKGLTAATVSAVESAKSTALVESSLRSAGDEVERNTQSINAWAVALATANGTTDETIKEQFALARSFTQTTEQARELVTASVDFAAAANINLTEAVRRLGRASQGSTEDVAKFVPEIKNLTKEQLAAGEATKLIAQRFADFAKGSLPEAVIAYTALTEALSENVDAVGRNIVENDELTSRLGNLATAVRNFSDDTSFLARGFGRISSFVVGLTANLVSVADTLLDVEEKTDGVAQAQREIVVEVNAHTKAEERLKRILDEINDGLPKFNSFLKDIGVTTESEVNTQIAELNQELQFARDNSRELGLTFEDLQRIEIAVAEETAKLKKETTEVSEEYEVFTDRLSQSSLAADGLRTSLEFLGREEEVRIRRLGILTRAEQAAAGSRQTTRPANFGTPDPTFSGLSGGVFTVPAGTILTDGTGRLIRT